jgi:1-acyl-sn-glycerol-3-phosphate acyltransferase
MKSTLYINTRALVRALTFLIGITGYFLSALVVYPYYKVSPMRARGVICHILKFYASFACWFMGIRVSISRANELVANNEKENYLIVSNHLSYTDILAICSHYPACFVTSMAMKRTPFLGQICILGGCVFVDRKNRKNLSLEVKEITDALREGLDVVIFPEATSTNGEDVIRFRRPLFRAAMDADIKVRPFSVNYRKVDDRPVRLNNRDSVFWYGDMTFADHLWGVFKIGRIDVELVEGQSIDTSSFTESSELALEAHTIVKKSFERVIS